MSTEKLENITQECVHSWPKNKLYSEFSTMTDILQWIEKNEDLTATGKKFKQCCGKN